ncbi:MAG TPA: deoxyhypusine synthase [Phycisphaerae bacterium]|nr:deoxyhypusine synthase [Phycisphaerae bacterium]
MKSQSHSRKAGPTKGKPSRSKLPRHHGRSDLARRRAAFMSGPQVEPIHLRPHTNVADMIDHCYARSGFNGRRLAEACQLYSRMLNSGATVGLTLSGAMTPIGIQGVLIDLMEAGFVDWIISTGANLYHDLHRTFGFPVTQGHWAMDDNELAEVNIARIYDTFIGDNETLLATDRVIQRAVERIERSRPLSSAEFHWLLGRQLARVAPRPEKSMLITAQRCDVPIYTSSPGDSSIALALIVTNLFSEPVRLDPVQDVIETAAIVRASERNGVVMVGGGSPKNFYLQTQPALDQFLYDHKGGHDYFIQLTTDAPHWGGLSGATPSEAKSWGKVKDATKNNVVVYSCASVTLPLLAQYVLIRNKPRRLRRVYRTLDQRVEELRRAAARNTKLRQQLKALGP